MKIAYFFLLSSFNIDFADEEIGGEGGMKLFVTKQEFKDLNIGCAFDEGGPSPVEQFPLFYTERIVWRKFHICVLPH